MVLIWLEEHEWDNCNLGFRPLAGIMVLIGDIVGVISTIIMRCFRPLAGIMVLIVVACRSGYSLLTIVSVPLRGLWFLSLSPR